jgi:surface antigen
MATSRRVVRTAIVAINVLLLGAIGVFAMHGSQAEHVLKANTGAPGANSAIGEPLDQLSSADIAVNAAKLVNLPETSGVINQAQSVKAELAVAPADTTVVAKPQTVATTFASSKDIKNYIVAPGDSVSSIAAKFSVTSDSIMWSNNLSSNNVNAGTKLVIPPVNGIVYTVQRDDTLDSLSNKYRANKDQLVAVNDIELTGLTVGARILIPNGQQPAAPAAVVYNVVAFGGSASYGSYTGYDYGFCTWYAAKRRADIGRPVPSNLGNANTWAALAAGYGIPTGPSPQVGAVAMKHARAPGHVAVVESVNADGSFWISEMNSYGQRSMGDSSPTGGWGVIDWKLIPADLTGTYTFIY